MTWLVGFLFLYLACGCGWACYVIWRLYAPAKAQQLRKVADDSGMGAAEQRRFLVLLAQPRAFLDAFALVVTAWPMLMWQTWGRILLEHLRYHWIRACLLAQLRAAERAQQKGRR